MYMKLTKALHVHSSSLPEISKLGLSNAGPFKVKKPGLEMSTIQSELDLSYRQRYHGVTIPEAYERLILDTYAPKMIWICLYSFTLYICCLQYEAAWKIFTPLLHRIDEGEMKPLPYKPGSRGPVEADELLAKAGYIQTHGYIWIPPTL
ncbi:hypothetical protein HHK36_032854 [Tetracentron sinense]|uniref:glucose-6-phosphate dehydrogenase (NADP(+)) n=1 Tax=Tetracentron sinense TaxID=13715 RepID=A0A834Y7C9_TETSI|nr:hypothetical protein HHK36_032854 [Tetracentron sinense]